MTANQSQSLTKPSIIKMLLVLSLFEPNAISLSLAHDQRTCDALLFNWQWYHIHRCELAFNCVDQISLTGNAHLYTSCMLAEF